MEQFGLLILFALVGLFQLLVRWLRSRAAAAAAAAPSTPVSQPEARAAPPAPPERRSRRPVPDDEELFVRVPLPAPVRARSRPAAPGVEAPRRRRLVVGTRAELRRTIVLMEVLGPCRAMTGQEHANSMTAR